MESDAALRLTADDWIAAAFAAFEEGGVAAVRVDALAKSLRVTRGSFYWHFKNRADLLKAVLERWDARNTEAAIAQNEATGGAAATRLARLLDMCSADDGRFEIGVRAWAGENAAARSIVERIDRRRTDYMADLLTEHGVPRLDALARAQVAYAAWIGTYIGAVPMPPEKRLETVRCLHDLLIDKGA